MTSQPLYMKPYPLCRATYTLYMRHHSHYLCPHNHSIDNITPTLCMTSHSPYVCHRLHYTRHHILTLWPQTTVFMSSHPLYLTLCPLYLSSHPLYWWYLTNYISVITSTMIHDIISIVYDMTGTVGPRSHCIHDIRYRIYDITSTVYDILSPIAATSQTLHLWIHINYI